MRHLRLRVIAGIRLITVGAVAVTLGAVTDFRNGRQLAAWKGLVPMQHSSGGRAHLVALVQQAAGRPFAVDTGHWAAVSTCSNRVEAAGIRRRQGRSGYALRSRSLYGFKHNSTGTRI